MAEIFPVNFNPYSSLTFPLLLKIGLRSLSALVAPHNPPSLSNLPSRALPPATVVSSASLRCCRFAISLSLFRRRSRASLRRRQPLPQVTQVLRMEKSVGESNNSLERSKEDLKPKYYMEFDSEIAAFNFYNAYARSEGFRIRRDGHGKDKKGVLTSRTFVCCKEGFRKEDKRDDLTKNPRAQTRTGCGAIMGIKLVRHTGKYCVYRFSEEHNHPLVKQDCVQWLSSHRNVTSADSVFIDLTANSGVPQKSAFELMGQQAGGKESLGFTRQDQKNYLRTVRQRKMKFGEAGYLMEYFSKQMLENPSFFYEMQLDNEDQITNIFWADAKMIMDYGIFGDVVSFDTTYKLNEANRPFAVFVGLNHHRETVVFGAALMYDETAASFIWLFETFLKAMCEKPPQTFIL